jgi:hypothetical protein
MFQTGNKKKLRILRKKKGEFNKKSQAKKIKKLEKRQTNCTKSNNQVGSTSVPKKHSGW